MFLLADVPTTDGPTTDSHATNVSTTDVPTIDVPTADVAAAPIIDQSTGTNDYCEESEVSSSGYGYFL